MDALRRTEAYVQSLHDSEKGNDDDMIRPLKRGADTDKNT
jgi:hypothetical protein